MPLTMYNTRANDLHPSITHHHLRASPFYAFTYRRAAEMALTAGLKQELHNLADKPASAGV
ncbi:MAG TPA: hypothetical protein DDZ88_30755 [Verrucomicrobiales bacterium]|nr:hypothetical protein [Verrucomicrobiales bacterium]